MISCKSKAKQRGVTQLVFIKQAGFALSVTFRDINKISNIKIIDILYECKTVLDMTRRGKIAT